MRQKYWNTLIALVTLAALWAIITYLDRRASRQAAKIETPKEEKIFALDSKHITSLAFRPRAGEVVTCRRGGGHVGDCRTQEACRRPGHALDGSQQPHHGHGRRCC